MTKNVLNNFLNIFYCFKVKFNEMNDPERSCLNVPELGRTFLNLNMNLNMNLNVHEGSERS
jgi:hypothetical protein